MIMIMMNDEHILHFESRWLVIVPL